MIRLLLCFLFLIPNWHATAQNGGFDPDFGTGGHLTISLGDKNTRAEILLPLPDGTFLIAGNSDQSYFGALINRSAFISKHFANGTPDTTFGDNGTLIFPNGPNGDSLLTDALLQTDGRILISAKINGSGALMRINGAGAFDHSFGVAGIAPANGWGKLLVSGSGAITVIDFQYDGHDTMYRFSRFSPDGSPDTSFGTNGVKIANISAYRFDLPFAATWQDGKMLIAGSSYNAADQQHAMLSRFDANGAPDTGFGTNGVVQSSFGAAPGYGYFSSVRVLGNKIIAAGVMEYEGGTGGYMGAKAVLARFEASGAPDLSFGIAGQTVRPTLFNGNDYFFYVTEQPDGKLLATGTAGHPYPNPQSHLMLTRLHPDGSADTSFGENGTVQTTNFNAETNRGLQLSVLPDGKLLCLGLTREASGENISALLCRIKPDLGLRAEGFDRTDAIVYPNPAHDWLFVTTTDTVRGVRMHNAVGQSVPIRAETQNNSTKVNVSALSAGIYVLAVESDFQTSYHKIFIR